MTPDKIEDITRTYNRILRLHSAIGLTAEEIDFVLALKPGRAASALAGLDTVDSITSLSYGDRLQIFVRTNGWSNTRTIRGIQLTNEEQRNLHRAMERAIELPTVQVIVQAALMGAHHATTVPVHGEGELTEGQRLYQLIFPPDTVEMTIRDHIERFMPSRWSSCDSSELPRSPMEVAEVIVKNHLNDRQQKRLTLPYSPKLGSIIEAFVAELQPLDRDIIDALKHPEPGSNNPRPRRNDHAMRVMRERSFDAIVKSLPEFHSILVLEGMQIRLNVSLEHLTATHDRIVTLKGAVKDGEKATMRLRALLAEHGIEEDAEPQGFVDVDGVIPALTRRFEGDVNEEFSINVRPANCMRNAGIEYVWQLVEKTEAEMLKTKNFGRKSLNEMKEVLTGLHPLLAMNGGRTLPKGALDEAKRLTIQRTTEDN